MFCGAGTIPLEAALLGRHVFASDASLYAVTLTKGKLYAPSRSDVALSEVDALLNSVRKLPMPDLRDVPSWVKGFFHPRTLQETIRVSEYLRTRRRYFLLSSIMGILHHQRPGFLSYPSSHLVPYLRSRKFPESTYPELYAYRELAPRLRNKVTRALSRPPDTEPAAYVKAVRRSSVERLTLPDSIDCVITSPPYMNTLDYERDNRLRLWFLRNNRFPLDRTLQSLNGFTRAIAALARKLPPKLNEGAYCVFIVGDRTTRSGDRLPSDQLLEIFSERAPTMKLYSVIKDSIPDIRRSRKRVAGVKNESIFVFRKCSK